MRAKKVGRQALPEGKKLVYLGFCVKPETLVIIDRIADENQEMRSKVLRDLVAAGLSQISGVAS